MSKDKILGAVIMVIAIVIIIVYTIVGPIDLYASTHASSWLATSSNWFRNIPGMNWQWAVVGPMWLVVILICIIAGWIGYSMLTTPPPVPLEELEEELESEENKSE